uniref:Uncharacterized protein n=1 Tax=Candidatus Kentrum sp. LPFa TaxID=2126335 RepID=A0A450WJZ1_9GAMM|nr:MAG: hypothetical protein BECKLPF1236B_GA0070989_11159 [Candidatus Kentron sp. LPFa]
MEAHNTILPLPENITNEWLKDRLQVDSLTDQYLKSYRYIRRRSVPIGFLRHDKAVIKLYRMERETEALPENLVANLETFIRGEIDKGCVNPTQGAGFAILSQGFLSINLWGRGNVLFTHTYTVENSFPELSAKPLEKTGVACTWEIRIMQHEYALWHRYLETGMTLADKKDYLQNFIAGKLY